MQKSHYIDSYERLVKAAIAEADKYYDFQGTPKEHRDYGEQICEAEAYAITEEVVGYYLLTYPDDYKLAWEDNMVGVTATDQDNEVSLILDKFWRAEDGK